jgi:hypothetical protein
MMTLTLTDIVAGQEVPIARAGTARAAHAWDRFKV